MATTTTTKSSAARAKQLQQFEQILDAFQPACGSCPRHVVRPVPMFARVSAKDPVSVALSNLASSEQLRMLGF